MSPNSFSCSVFTLFLRLNSKTPEKAVTTSAFGFSESLNKELNTNLGLLVSSLKISLTLSVTEYVS